MPFAPYQWRAGKGYIPPPDAVPPPITMSAGAAMYAFPFGAPIHPQYSHLIAHGPGFQPVLAADPPPEKKKKLATVPPPPPPPPASAASSKASSAPKTIVQGNDWRIVGKTPINGKWTITIPPPPPKSAAAACSTISPADSVSSTGSGTSLGSAGSTKPAATTTKTHITVTSRKTRAGCSSTKTATASSKRTSLSLKLRGGDASCQSALTSSSTCPSLRPGVNYLFPARASHTILHIFNKASPIWEKRYEGKQMEFKMFKVGTKFSVKEIVERVVGRGGGKGKGKDGNGLLERDLEAEGWSVTECHEQGGGCWKKGTTIPYASDKAAGSLESMGWDAKRGKERGPVWLVVHKA